MKNLIISLLAAGMLLISSAASSQGTLKIGHVNMNELMAALPERDSAQVQLERETKSLENTYQEMKDAYSKIVSEYQDGLKTFAEPVRQAKESEILDKQKRLSEFEQNANANLQQRNTALFQPIYDKIVKAIEKVATQNGFTYILDLSKGSVIFTAKESQNINTLVLKELKK
jgi:outer membrane protein